MTVAKDLPLRPLGHTGLVPTQLSLGVLPIGPAQLNVPPAQGAKVVAAALDGGVNFVDTAQSYRTYNYIKPALAGRDPEEIIVASKSAAASYADMSTAIKEAQTELGLAALGCFTSTRRGPRRRCSRSGPAPCVVWSRPSGPA